MKKFQKSVTAVAVLIVLLAACGAQAAAAEAETPTVNILLLASEDTGDSFFPIMPMIVSLDLQNRSVKVINFYFQTQIFATAETGEALSVPMSLLPHCEIPEIVKAYENTYGIPIDRYLIYLYEYGSYEPIADVYDLLFPITLDIPEEFLGSAKYTTINGNMKALSKSMKREYTPIEEAGPHALGSVGFLAYYGAIPDRVWESGDRFTMAMEDYKLWDMKNRAVIEGLRPMIALMDGDTVLSFLKLFIKDQTTDITEEDIARWSLAGLNLAVDSPYLTVPGFEGVEMQTGDAGSLKGISEYQLQMLKYDNEAIAQAIHTFLYAD
ncbi:MAG: hypothetical protein ABIK64_00715 [Bacillota bacterium]